MKLLRIVILVSAVFAALLPLRLQASCGSASCPLNTYRPLHAGFFGLTIVHEYIDQNRIRIGAEPASIGAIPEEHDEVRTLNERTTLRLQAGLSERFGLMADIPMIHREHDHIHNDSAGGDWERWNFTGLGDILLAGNYAIVSRETDKAGFQLDLIAGVKLSSGVTTAVNNDGEEAEVTIQPGTGSTDMVIGMNLSVAAATVPSLGGLYSALPLTLGLSYQVNGAGSYDYRVGNSMIAHAGTAWQFLPRASATLQFNGRFQGWADPGSTGEPKANTGGTWIYITPGLAVESENGFAASAHVQFPIYQNVHGIQQTAPFNLVLSAGYSFDLAGE